MDSYIIEWLNLVVRWIHVITGIAWIGSSFFFNWLDSQLTPPENQEPKCGGRVVDVTQWGFLSIGKNDDLTLRNPKSSALV